MRNFLPAGIINDSINDICEKVTELKQQLAEGDNNSLQKGLSELEDMAFELAVFIEKFSCQPLIYTGKGTTEEIISRLEWALTFSEETDPIEYFKYNESQSRNRRSK